MLATGKPFHMTNFSVAAAVIVGAVYDPSFFLAVVAVCSFLTLILARFPLIHSLARSHRHPSSRPSTSSAVVAVDQLNCALITLTETLTAPHSVSSTASSRRRNVPLPEKDFKHHSHAKMGGKKPLFLPP
jgi:hypothetical protein